MTPPRDPAVLAPSLGQFRIGEWTVDPADGTLRENGKCVRLEPRVMDVLAYLASHPDRVVSKEELISAVWGGSFVEEGALTQVIHALRKVLGDDARQPRYIQTVPKRGYRLVSPVVVGEEAAPSSLAEPQISAAPSPIAAPSPALASSQRSRKIAIQVCLWLALITAALLTTSSRIQQPLRIVVLPFENRGTPQGDDAYLAGGLTDEINTALGSIPSLQVVSPPSRRDQKTIPEIGELLRVDYVLTGTVQWGKDLSGQARVRVLPRLTRVEDGVQVWAETFEEPVTYIFEVEEKLARAVMGEMGVVLRPEQKQAIERPPTENPDAYQAYIRGLGYKNQPFYSEEHLDKATFLFNRAGSLDPGFAEAWAQLSQTQSYLAFNRRSPEHAQAALVALERAQNADPANVEVLLAKAYYTYRCLQDYRLAESEFRAVVSLFPGKSEAFESLGLILRRTGKLEESIEIFKKGLLLSPQEVRFRWWIGEVYRAMRQYAQANDYLSQATSIAPDQDSYWLERAENVLAWTGDPGKVEEVIAESPNPEGAALSFVAFHADLYRRDYRSAIARFNSEKLAELTPELRSRIYVLLVMAHEKAGDRFAAMSLARKNFEFLRARVDQAPKDMFCRAYLAVTLAQLGEYDIARQYAEQAAQMARRDPFSGPRIFEITAMVDVLSGSRQRAISELKRLLSMEYQSAISEVDVKENPFWDALH